MEKKFGTFIAQCQFSLIISDLITSSSRNTLQYKTSFRRELGIISHEFPSKLGKPLDLTVPQWTSFKCIPNATTKSHHLQFYLCWEMWFAQSENGLFGKKKTPYEHFSSCFFTRRWSIYSILTAERKNLTAWDNLLRGQWL